jgi:hypothetical protein
MVLLNQERIMSNIKSTTFETMEAKGLGIAPFQCIGVYSIPAPSEATENTERYNLQLNAMPKTFGIIGTCACCGMNLRHNYLIRSSDKQSFVLGSSCVEKLGDGTAMSQMELTKKRLNSRVRKIKKIEKSILQLQDYISILEKPVENWPIGSDYYNSGIKVIADSSGKDMRCGIICFHPIRLKTGDQSSYSGFNKEKTYQKAMDFIQICKKTIENHDTELTNLKAKAFK